MIFMRLETKGRKNKLKIYSLMFFLFGQKRACFKNSKNTIGISVTEIYFTSSLKLWSGTTIFCLELFGLFPENELNLKDLDSQYYAHNQFSLKHTRLHATVLWICIEFIINFFCNHRTDNSLKRVVGLIPNWFSAWKWVRNVFKHNLHSWIRCQEAQLYSWTFITPYSFVFKDMLNEKEKWRADHIGIIVGNMENAC